MATYGEYIQSLEEKYGKEIIVLERPIHKEKDMMKAIIRCPKCGSTSVIYYGNDLYGCCNLECEYKWKEIEDGNIY